MSPSPRRLRTVRPFVVVCLALARRHLPPQLGFEGAQRLQTFGVACGSGASGTGSKVLSLGLKSTRTVHSHSSGCRVKGPGGCTEAGLLARGSGITSCCCFSCLASESGSRLLLFLFCLLLVLSVALVTNPHFLVLHSSFPNIPLPLSSACWSIITADAGRITTSI